MTLFSRHTPAIAFSLLALSAAVPAIAQDAMAPDAMGGVMAADGAMGAPMIDEGKTIKVTIENLLTGQPFSPGIVESHAADAAPLFRLGDKASDALVAVAEGGNIGAYSVAAAMNADSSIGDAQLAIHTLPGQTRTIYVHVDAAHPLIDSVWMLGNTNDGFSGFTGVDGYSLTTATTLEVRGYDAGSELNSEKKGFLGALGGGNARDPENGVVTWHAGIRGDADAPSAWNWDVDGPVARVTFTPIEAAL